MGADRVARNFAPPPFAARAPRRTTAAGRWRAVRASAPRSPNHCGKNGTVGLTPTAFRRRSAARNCGAWPRI